MKIVLAAINAKYIHANLAIYSLRAFSDEYKEQIQIKEYTINQYTEDILADLYKEQADMVAFSCYIWNMGMVEELAELLHQLRPEMPIWFGGPEVSYDAAECLQRNHGVTGILRGEGEESFHELMQYYIGGSGKLQDIRGIIYREGGLLVDNGWREVMDLNKVPFVYEEMEDMTDGVEEIRELIVDEVGGFIDPLLNERLLGILSTKENVNLETLGFVNDIKKYTAIITPIDIAGERLGTLFVYRENDPYDIDDIILSEYGTTVVGLEMMRSVNEENAEETRKVQIVKSAISTLSFSELEAITHIFEEMDGKEGILVASKIADRVGITRSVIVNALRKFESAGVIESRSSGMKGTYIKVLNDVVFDELEQIKKENNIK